MINTIEIHIEDTLLSCRIPAIADMNQYMLNLSNDFPFKKFFRQESIKGVIQIDPILVIESQEAGKFECIAGARALKILSDYEIKTCLAHVVHNSDISETIQLAIKHNILPLIYWPVALSNNIRCYKFINELRKCLPTEYKGLIPSTSSLKKRMNVTNFQGRRSLTNKSELELLLERIRGGV